VSFIVRLKNLCMPQPPVIGDAISCVMRGMFVSVVTLNLFVWFRR